MKNLFFIVAAFAFSISSFSQVRPVPVKSIEERLNDEYCTGLFKTADATYFDFMDDRVSMTVTGYLNVLDWLQGRVAGVQIYKTSGNLSIPYIRNQRASVYIDEIPVSPDWTSILTVTDIAMIKIIKGPFLGGGWQGGGGAILIYTTRGEDEGEEDIQ